MIKSKFPYYFIDSKNKFIQYISSYGFYFVIGASLAFGRPFVGIYIFGIRLGELLIAAGFLLSIFLAMFYIDDFSDRFNKNYIFSLLVFSFLVIVFLTGSSLTNTYAYKSSSYIWTIGYIFVGYYFISKSYINKYILNLILFVPLFTYVISTGNYPNFMMSFFYSFSDKFLFLKGSDLTISYIAVTFFIKNLNFSNKFKFSYFIYFGFLFLPLLLFASRGAFISCVIFMIFELYFYRNFILKNYKFSIITFLLGSLIFIVSSYRVEGSLSFEEISQPESVTNTIGNIVQQKKTKDLFLGFYINGEGYLDSWDPTTSWRLDIWQDVIYDMSEKNIILKGYGYKEIFPIMKDPTAPGRLGRDGLNENVHNFVINVLGRGGLVHLLIYSIFQFYLIFEYRKKHSNLYILSLIFPLFFMSGFDATMESVHFPIVLYCLYGYFLKNGCTDTNKI